VGLPGAAARRAVRPVAADRSRCPSTCRPRSPASRDSRRPRSLTWAFLV